MTFPVEKRLEAVSLWLTLGNFHQVAGAIGIPYATVKSWRAQPWWAEMEAELVATRRAKTSIKLASVVDKSLEVIDDRLSNGDFVWDSKNSEIVRRPVSLRDASNSANSLMQRAAILEKMQDNGQVAEATISVAEQLKALAQQFALMNNRSKIGAETIEYTESTLQQGPEESTWESGIQPINQAGTTSLYEGSESEVLPEEGGEA